MRAIIDARQDGLPDAPAYYRFFPREPSPAGDISIETNKIEALLAIDLGILLDRLLSAMNPKQGTGEKEFLVVCHAIRSGLLIPLSGTSDQFATQDQLEAIMTVDVAVKDRDRIRQMPSSTDSEKAARIQGWTKLFDGPPKKANIAGTFTEQEAEATFSNWLNDQAKRMKLTTPALDRLIAKMNQVRAGQLVRLEFRACNVGDDASALETLKKFFGAKKIVAPKAETFFLSPIPPQVLPDQRRLSEFAASPTGPFSGRAVARLRDAEPARRKLGIPIPLCGFHMICTVVEVFLFAVKIWEPSIFHYLWASATTSVESTRFFINQSILPGASYSGGAFPLAGFWTLRTPGRTEPFLLPNDGDYRSMIVAHGS